MKNDVVLINSPLFLVPGKPIDEDFLPPLGLGYIATELKQNNINTILIDAISENLSVMELVEGINLHNPLFVAINVFSTNIEIVKKIIEDIELDISFIIGGLATKSLFKKIFKFKTKNPITVVCGDGERIIVDIVKNNVREQPTRSIKGRRYFLIDQNSSYFPHDISNVILDRSFFKGEPYKNNQNKLEASIIASRGCPFDCTFCSAAQSLNKNFPVRERKAFDIIKEIDCLTNTYKELESIRILDDLFLKNKRTIKNAVKIFSRYELSWSGMANVTSFNKIKVNLIEGLKGAGCYELFFGLESGSERILKAINKTYELKIIRNSIINVFKAGINVKGYFILGFPSETEEDYRKTLFLAKELKEQSKRYHVTFRISIFQFRPYHSTIIFDSLKKSKVAYQSAKPNDKLTKLIGRKNFNFHSGNFSSTSEDTLLKYMDLIYQLND